jgi:hypothetical protein
MKEVEVRLGRAALPKIIHALRERSQDDRLTLDERMLFHVLWCEVDNLDGDAITDVSLVFEAEPVDTVPQ